MFLMLRLHRELNIILTMKTYTGNSMLLMSDTYFNGKFDFVKQSGKLVFTIHGTVGREYLVRVVIGDKVELPMGKQYTVRFD